MSLRTRLILAFAVIIFLTLGMVASGFVYIVREYQAQREMDRLAGLATVLQNQLRRLEVAGTSRDELLDYIRSASDELDAGVVLLGPQGMVLFDSEDRLVGRRVDLSSAARVGPIRRMRVAAFTGEDDLIFVVVTPLFAIAPANPPANARDRAQLALGLVTRQQSLTSAWMDMAPRLATVAAIALLVSIGVAWLLARSIAGRLADMTRATEEIARGRHYQEIPVRGDDDVARLARAFNLMSREVSDSQRTLRDFVTNVSHDLRTPLTSIQGFSQALIDGAVRGPEGAAHAGRIIFDESERMRTMVEDLLELSRIESGQINLEIGPVELGVLAERARQRVEVQAAEQQIRLEAETIPTPPAAADGRRIEQVLDNLLSNALRFTPQGGTVTLRVRPVDDGGRYVMVAIHNTGSHIPPHELERVFERFYQVDKSRANVPAGSGLGLAIAREIVQAHGGSLRAVSDPEAGTEFPGTFADITRTAHRSVVRYRSNGRVDPHAKRVAASCGFKYLEHGPRGNERGIVRPAQRRDRSVTHTESRDPRGTHLPALNLLPPHLMRALPLFVFVLLACACALTPSAALAADEKSEIGGTVYFDRNRDGSPAGGDPGLRGIQVTLNGPKGSKRDTTDSKGAYNFNDLPAGQYTVTAAPPAAHQLTTALSIPVKVDGKNAIRVVDFGLAAVVAATPTASPTAKASATATPTATSTPAASNLLQRPNPASSPQSIGDVTQSIGSALDERARLSGSPAAIVIPTMIVTPTATPDGGRGGVAVDGARLRAASLEPLRYAAGRDQLAAVRRYENGETVWLGVPFKTQMDGTYFSAVNCGPASLSMAMGAFGIKLDPNNIREYVNFLSGNVDADSGTSLDHIARVAREAGLRTLDLYSARGYRAWDLNLVRQHVAQGHPVITLTRYQSLPGNANSRFNTDHYVVITGLSGDDFIYNDPAYGSNAGYGLLISGPDLERAWVFSSIPAHSLALALDGDAQIPDWLRRRAETRVAPLPVTGEPAATPEVEIADAMTYTGAVPGDQELPALRTDVVAQTLLDLIAAPRVAEQAFVAPPEVVAAIPAAAIETYAVADSAEVIALPGDAAEALVLPSSDAPDAPPSTRLAEVFILDPTLVTMFLALLGIFLPPALSRRR